MKKYILMLLLVCIGVSAQKRTGRSFFWEANPVVSENSAKVYVTYRIPFEQMVFVRENGNFRAGIKFYIEAESDSGDIVYRGFDERTVETSDYESTNSTNEFLNGLLVFETTISNLKLSPEVELTNIKRTYQLPPKEVEVNLPDTSYLYQPISVQIIKHDDEFSTYLNNFSGVIPFSNINYSMLLPVSNIDANDILVNIMKDDSLLFSKQAKKIMSNEIEIELAENVLRINETNQPSNIGYYLLESINFKLDEGNYEINVVVDDNNLQTSFEVLWVQKPRSLFNPEFAIQILDYIEKDGVVRELLDFDEDDYPKALNDYWRKYDSNKSTRFNEVMYEFYTRVDSADIKFSVVKTDRGSKTDRGRIYIKFGKPDSIIRTYSATNNVIETWLYSRVNKKFYFTDKSGLGDFILMN